MPAKTEKPLKDRTIVVTRAADQSAGLVEKLEKQGATVLELPLIQTALHYDAKDCEDAFRELWTYEWVIFTSPNGVRYFFDLFFKQFDDIRSFGGARIAVIGKATAEALRKYYIRADLVPDTATSEALADALTKEQTLDNLNVLIVTGNQNTDTLRLALEAALAIVDCFQVYSTGPTDLSKHPAADKFRKNGADAIIFASGSAVENFVAQAKALKTEPNALRPLTCSIGPSTSETMRKAGIPVDIETAEASTSAIVKALTGHFSAQGQ
ncbi:MAG: uroporphyrinogen-III synthase [Opitutales bacterium]|jgi:uroporphyrinogen III methyltransferase/synthase